MNPNRTTAPASSRITKPGPLFPECKHVEAFGDDGDYAEESDDEGESYVTLDLSRVDQTLIPNSSTYRLIVSPGNFFLGKFALIGVDE